MNDLLSLSDTRLSTLASRCKYCMLIARIIDYANP